MLERLTMASRWINRHSWVPVTASVLFIMTRYLVPHYIDNETVYALGPIKILHPGFLPNHPFLQRFNPFFWVYDTLSSPLYVALDWLWATLLLRVLIWVFQLWALGRLCRTLGMAWWGLPLLVMLWLNVEQTWVAGEWIIGCASAKPVSYGFVLLALEATLRGDLRRSGWCSGLAACFHVLVGGWSAFALGAAILVRYRTDRPLQRLATYGVPMAGLALLGLIPAVLSILTSPAGTAGAAAETARLYVTWITPFHLDPDYFIGDLEWLKLPLYAVATFALIWRFTPREKGQVLVPYLAALAAVFIAGLLARRVEWYPVLKYYPFRVADGMFPLTFWIGVVLLLHRAASRVGRYAPLMLLATPLMASGVKYLNNVLEPAPNQDPALTLERALLASEPRATAYWTRETGREWWDVLAGRQRTDLEEMEDWIRHHTDQAGVFIIPPWEDSFTLGARRAEFISWKTFTVERMAEWKDRFEAVNRGPSKEVGRAVLQEIRANYPRLTTEQILTIRRRYRVDYFLTTSDLPVGFPLIHQVGPWHLYQLAAGPP